MLILLAAVSCSDLTDDMGGAGQDGAIVLHFSTPGVDVKGSVEDNEFESYMSHLDVIIYEVNNGSSYVPFHHERVYVSNTPDGSVSLHKTKNDFKENVGYKFFVIANSTNDENIYYTTNGSLKSYEDFLNLDQTDEMIHLSGVDHEIMNTNYPQMFLMDGVAYKGDSEPVTAGNIIINDSSDTSDDVRLKITLRRAAAKVQILITPGSNVTFTKELMAQSHGYMVRNMPVRTTLSAEKDYPLNDGGTNPYWKSTTISQSPYFEMAPITDNTTGKIVNYQIKLTLYCYSHTWNSDEAFNKGTSVVMMLPLVHSGTTYINNYYQISFSKKEAGSGTESLHLIKRNTFYDLRINLDAPGAEDYNEPEQVKDITYFTAPWEKIDLEVSGESQVKYLKINKNKLYMYNVTKDNTSLYFSSSSPVTVQIVQGSAYYKNKYDEKKDITGEQLTKITASVPENAISGNISIDSAEPLYNTIQYFTIRVTNADGLSQDIEVEQYPLIYITNSLPWYSYRDDYYYRNGHTYVDDKNNNFSSLVVSGDNPTTYRYDGDHIVSVATVTVDTDTKKVTYQYTYKKPGNSQGFTSSKVRGDKAYNSQNYSINYYYYDIKSKKATKKEENCETHNVRNYHIRMMASSGNYKLGHPALDENGYTAGDEDNAQLVSPSFVIASRLGAVLSSYSGLSDMDNEEKLVVFADHCKQYVEVDDVNDDKKDPVVVYDNWRLPTKAELEIIINLQATNRQDNNAAIDYLLNGEYYMSASGPVFNIKNDSNIKTPETDLSKVDVAIRCVRDAY